MLRGRRVLVVIVVVTLALVGAGLWRRSTLLDERTAAAAAARRAAQHTVRVQADLTAARTTSVAVAADTATIEQRADELEQLATELAARVRGLEQARDEAALSAWLTGGELGALRECLDGVNRALNQVSVGDPAAVTSLGAVERACRTVGP